MHDSVASFIEAASVPRVGAHVSGTLENAAAILAREPDIATHSVHAAAILADEPAVRTWLARDPANAGKPGGPYGWDPLTYLCFSRYLRLDPTRSEAFVSTARALLDAGASANTGWYEPADRPDAIPTFESAIYGAAAVARHAGLTRLLLERGADPNDEETPYHVPETYDNTITRILLDSRRLSERSLSWMLLRKTDWHDRDGVRLLLEAGADPNRMTRFGDNALHHAVRRDNELATISLLLDSGANPALPNRDGQSAIVTAARRGRGDVLAELERRGVAIELTGVDRLIAACAMDDREAVGGLIAREPALGTQLVEQGGTRLAEFAGNGNRAGVRHLLDSGVRPEAIYGGDPYFDIAKNSTALHVASWRAWPNVVEELIARGAPVNALDGAGRSALQLAVKACVDSYWVSRRSPASVRALLAAGASPAGIALPTGYDEVDALLRRASA